ncbi:MAG: hypothetical protein ACHQE6_12055, partial [Solirubrobacterales bacterium]
MYGALGDTTLLRGEFARVVGAEHVQALHAGDGRDGGARGERLSPYDHDATRSRGLRGRAELVVAPGSAAEVAEVLALCY